MFDNFTFTRRGMIAVAAAQLLIGMGGSAVAQDAEAWPTRNVKLVVPANPGGGTDTAGRLFASELEEKLDRSFVVVNQPTGGGSVAAETVRTSRPDGLSLLFYHSGLMSSYHSGVYPHNPAEEFTPVAVMPVGGSLALTVAPDSGYESVGDLIAAAKENPDKVTLGVQLKGASHFVAGLLMQDSEAPFRVVEAGSDSDKLVALQGRNIDAAIVNTSQAAQYVEAGKVKVLGTIAGNPDRDPMAVDYPSLAELGFENTVYGLDFYVLGPKEMDDALARRINEEFAAVLDDPEVTERLNNLNLPVTMLTYEDGKTRIEKSEEQIGQIAEQIGMK